MYYYLDCCCWGVYDEGTYSDFKEVLRDDGLDMVSLLFVIGLTFFLYGFDGSKASRSTGLRCASCCYICLVFYCVGDFVRV